MPRRRTMVEDAQSSEFHHNYLIRKPAFVTTKSTSTTLPLTSLTSTNQSGETFWAAHANGNGIPSGQTTGDPASLLNRESLANPVAEKRRFELFLDLTWAGIIANIAEIYAHGALEAESETSIGRVLDSSIILTLIAWQLWKYLQIFMSTYATNDIIERSFVFWYLILALIFGNNAPYYFAEKDQHNTAVVAFLIAKGSLLALESVYAIFIPGLRRSVAFRWIVAAPLVACWVGSILVEYPEKAGFAFLAVALDFLLTNLVSTPWMERFLHDKTQAEIDVDHWVERLRDFFIIILGEGVINFIRQSPLGGGLTWKTGSGIMALALFYILVALYFNGDQSRNYIHAVKRAWWRRNIWFFIHVIMFYATLVLGVAVRFIIAHPHTNSDFHKEAADSATEPPSTPNLLSRATSKAPSHEVSVEELMWRAKWTTCITLSLVITCMTVGALLHSSQDRPGTLKINNRYIRLAPRIIVVVVSLLLPLSKEMQGSTLLGTTLIATYSCFMWEYTASLDKHGGFIEKS